jgi:hypothetical protein
MVDWTSARQPAWLRKVSRFKLIVENLTSARLRQAL